MGATMTDVYIVVFIIIGLLISYPGLAAALNLLLPRITDTAYRRLTLTPFGTFVVGLIVTVFFCIWAVILSAVNNGVVKAFAGFMLLLGLGLHAIGSASLSRMLGERIGALTGADSKIKDLIRGAVVYELAALTPLVGWFLFLPLATCSMMGAAAFGLIRWPPRERIEEEKSIPADGYEEEIQSVWASDAG